MRQGPHAIFSSCNFDLLAISKDGELRRVGRWQRRSRIRQRKLEGLSTRRAASARQASSSFAIGISSGFRRSTPTVLQSLQSHYFKKTLEPGQSGTLQPHLEQLQTMAKLQAALRMSCVRWRMTSAWRRHRGPNKFVSATWHR
jgi:hypothetical protein